MPADLKRSFADILSGLTGDWLSRQQQITVLFTFVFFALTALVGSASSALFIGAGLWTILLLGLGRVELIADRGARILALVFAFYYAAGAVNAVVHWGDRDSLFLLIERLPFLAFLPVLSHMSLSSGPKVLDAMERGALTGVVLAFPVVVTQLFRSNWRPEAFSGNPSIFALAMTLLFVICCVAARRRGGHAELLFAAGAALAAFCVLVAGTRALWPLVVLAPAAAWFLVRVPEKPRLLNWKMAALLFTALLIGATVASEHIGNRVKALSQELSEDTSEQARYREGSLGSRLAMWRCAADIATRHPLAGTGVGGAVDAMRDCARNDSARWHALSHFHNFALDGLAKGGLLELLARLLALLVPPIVIARSAMHRHLAAPLKQPVLVLAGLVAATYLASGLFGIFVGHDIADALYLYGLACLCTVMMRGAIVKTTAQPLHDDAGPGRRD